MAPATTLATQCRYEAKVGFRNSGGAALQLAGPVAASAEEAEQAAARLALRFLEGKSEVPGHNPPSGFEVRVLPLD